MWLSRSQKIKCSVLNSIIVSSPFLLKIPIFQSLRTEKTSAAPYSQDTNQNAVTTRLMVPLINILTFWLCNISRIALFSWILLQQRAFLLYTTWNEWLFKICLNIAMIWMSVSPQYSWNTKDADIRRKGTGRCLGHEDGAQDYCSF